MVFFRTPLTRGISALLLAAWLSSPALAQSNAQGLLDNRFVINVGGYLVDTELTASLNGQSTNNPQIDFDETFGEANGATRPRLDMLWRVSPRHHLRFQYFDNTTERTRTIDREVAWGDYVFRANASVASKVDFRVYELSYEYAFLREPSYEVAATLGAHVTDIAISLSGIADLVGPNGGVVSTGLSTGTADTLAPLPVAGLRGGWVIAPNWYLDAQAQIFALNSNGYEGSWSDLRLGVTWMFHKNFGVGLAYNRFATDVDVSKSNYRGSLEISYSGVLAYLTGTF